MSACIGSCIGGPVMNRAKKPLVSDYLKVANYAGEKDFDVDQPNPAELKKNFARIEHKLPTPSESEIMSVLRQMGKFKASEKIRQKHQQQKFLLPFLLQIIGHRLSTS